MTEQEFADEVCSFCWVVRDMTRALTADHDEHGRLCGVVRACTEYAEASKDGRDPVETLLMVEGMFRRHRKDSTFYDGLVGMTEVLIRLHDKVVDTE